MYDTYAVTHYPSFHVVIDGSTAPSVAPSDGFIDRNPILTYNIAGITLANSISKRRANNRFIRLIEQMQTLGNLYTSNYVATGATAILAPTSFSFDVLIEHGIESLHTIDETDTTQLLLRTSALKRSIARSLLIHSNDNSDVYDPTTSASRWIGLIDNTPVQRRFFQQIYVETGALYTDLTTAEATITITEIV